VRGRAAKAAAYASPHVPNVLHISQADGGGGSARSAYRLHSTLRELGWGSRMLVGERGGSDPDVRLLKRNTGWRAADRACSAVLDRLDLQYVFYPSSFAVAADPWFREAAVVQLYNTHGSYFSHSALPFLSRRRPVVWRLSDQWAFTGHVAYSYDCERWRDGCGSCPYLSEYPRLRRDTTAALWRWKDRVYGRSRLTIVAPSTWLERLARESPLLRRFDVRRIPNGVDLDLYRPRDRSPRERPVVLFASAWLDDRRKGGHLLREALARLSDLDFELVSAGDRAPLGRALGVLGPEELARAYADADVFVLPTLAENLPNTILESLACGTPVVSFDVGGVGDAVRHLETGWLAAPGDAAALAQGLRALLTDPELRERLGRNGRALAEREWASDLEGRRFAELYEELLAA
jgi:glycosyltransferase involved in cell wall biosynthesis